MAQQKNAGQQQYGWNYSQPRDQIVITNTYAYPMTDMSGRSGPTVQVTHQNHPGAEQGQSEDAATPPPYDGKGMLPGGRLFRSAIVIGIIFLLMGFSLWLYNENQGLEGNHKKAVAVVHKIIPAKGVDKLRLQNSRDLGIQKTIREFKDKYGHYALHGAVDLKNETVVKLLVENNGTILISTRNHELETPLHRATLGIEKTSLSSTSLRIIKYLINNGVDVYAKDAHHHTFLHNLLINNTTLTPSQFNDLAEFLIEKKYANLFNIAEGIYDITPFQLAVKELEVRESTLRLLQVNAVNFNAVDIEGDSVIFYAVFGKRSTSFLSRLVHLGADWRHRNKNGESLLHWAAARCNVNAMHYLIYLGLDVNGKDLDGDTPLHCVLYDGEGSVLDGVRLLVGKGADKTIRNDQGLTPLAIALKDEDLVDKDRIVELLKIRR